MMPVGGMFFFGMSGSKPLTSGDPRTSWNRDGGRPGGRKKEILSVASGYVKIAIENCHL